MKEIADLAELTFELHDRVLSLVDGRERIHHLLLIVRHTLLDLVDGLERRNNVGVHQRLHLGQRRQDRSHVDAELPVGARWQDCGQCERNHCYFQQRWAIPPRRLALGLFGSVNGLREFWHEKSLTPPEEQLAPLVWILLGVRHGNLPIAR